MEPANVPRLIEVGEVRRRAGHLSCGGRRSVTVARASLPPSPLIRWQLRARGCVNRVLARLGRLAVGAGRRLRAGSPPRPSKSAGDSATTRMRMLAWDRPQNSVHWPRYIARAASASSVQRLRRGRGRRRACR